MRKPNFFHLLIILFLLFSYGCATTDIEPTRPTKTAFKGIELYSWQGDDGAWSFSILVGTNRIKTSEEVMANPLDIEEVKEGLCQLAVGEQVFWIDWELNASNGEVLELEKPPREIIDELIASAISCEVDIFVTLEDGN